MNGPNVFIRHLADNLYHPRSDAHSNAVCLAILDDLIVHCPPLAHKAASGDLVAKLNHTVKVNYQDWNIDLALGPPPSLAEPPSDSRIRFGIPVTVEIAIEAKAVMTEHGKARRNRLRDLQAFHNYAHTYNQKTIATGIVAVNISPIFWSPLRRHDDITIHKNIDVLGEQTVRIFRGLPLRHTPGEGPGIEAFSVLVVKHDNLAKNPEPPLSAGDPRTPELVSRPPAPQVGDPMHYATMIRRTCTAYQERWTS